METTNVIEIECIADIHTPLHTTLRWLGPGRRSVLRLRDRAIPWQLRHFYYHHEAKALLGTQLSLGLLLGHALHLLLQTTPALFRSPLELLYAGSLLVPGLKFAARRISLPRGKILYQADQPANDVMLLVTGYGRLCMDYGDGRKLTVGLVAPGDLFGEEALLDNPERESSFEAVLQSEIDIITREEFTRVVNENHSLLRAVTEHLAQRLLTQQRHMVRLAFEPVEKRLAWILLQLAAATGGDDRAEPTIPIYHKDLAGVLGVWRETITAMLNRWASEGLISQQPGQITLKDIKRLQKIADDHGN
jgi:CRP/FNR family cyclic AMP-dependent transcriptional regulator